MGHLYLIENEGAHARWSRQAVLLREIYELVELRLALWDAMRTHVREET